MMRWVLQNVVTAESREEAEIVFRAVRMQECFISGRILEPVGRQSWHKSAPSQVWKIQTFHEGSAAPKNAEEMKKANKWLPDGLRWVLLDVSSSPSVFNTTEVAA